MRLEGLRPQPGLHGSPSDATGSRERAPDDRLRIVREPARYGKYCVGMMRTRASWEETRWRFKTGRPQGAPLRHVDLIGATLVVASLRRLFHPPGLAKWSIQNSWRGFDDAVGLTHDRFR